MHKLIEFVCDELEDLERKVERGGKLSMTEVQYMDTLAHTKKNLLKSEEMMEEGGYSMDREYAYAREGGRYSNARMGRGRGSNAMRDSMGRYSSNRYSYDDGYSMEGDFRADLEELMRYAPNEQIKQKLQMIMTEV